MTEQTPNDLHEGMGRPPAPARMKSHGLIDRRIPVPLYFQIAERLRHEIRSKKLQEGDVLTTDERVQHEFRVSRATARKAIDELVDEGLVERITGKGTLVSQLRLQVPLPSMLSFTEELERRGMRPRTGIVSVEWATPSESAAHALGLSARTRVLRLERIRFADEKPVLHSVDILPEQLGIGPEEDFSGSLYALMEARGIALSQGQCIIQAAVTDPRLGKLLRVKKGFPVLALRRTSYDAEGAAVLYEEAACRGDLYSYAIRLVRDPRTRSRLK